MTILILLQLNMHKWNLIRGAVNLWCHSGSNYKYVLMYVSLCMSHLECMLLFEMIMQRVSALVCVSRL